MDDVPQTHVDHSHQDASGLSFMPQLSYVEPMYPLTDYSKKPPTYAEAQSNNFPQQQQAFQQPPPSQQYTPYSLGPANPPQMVMPAHLNQGNPGNIIYPGGAAPPSYVVVLNAFCVKCQQNTMVDKYNLNAVTILIIVVVIWFPTGLYALFMLPLARMKKCMRCGSTTHRSAVGIYVCGGIAIISWIILIAIVAVFTQRMRDYSSQHTAQG